ncbi:hypothetical protein BHM03_00025164 [Ensete ventricosum]|nr:hypothetical protein BHM03_00025164 [Ensete ventricosum]
MLRIRKGSITWLHNRRVGALSSELGQGSAVFPVAHPPCPNFFQMALGISKMMVEVLRIPLELLMLSLGLPKLDLQLFNLALQVDH